MVDVYGFQRFIDEIHGASEERDLVGAVSRMGDRMGFRWFAYLSLGDRQHPEIASTYAPAWVQHYFTNRFEHIDPCIVASREQTQPFRWGSLRPPVEIPKNVVPLYDDARSYGIRGGITIPVLGPSGRWAAFTLATDEENTTSLARQSDQTSGMMIMMALQFHTRLMVTVPRFASDARRNVLSEQQLRCLQACAHGLPMKAIAYELGVSHRTVVHHLNEARRKMGAKNLAHAVRMALHYGLFH